MQAATPRQANSTAMRREVSASIEAAHTPGPWEISRLEDDDRLTITNETRRGYIPVAELRYGYEGKIEVEQQANARLIAAAPDLLEALNCVAETLFDLDERLRICGSLHIAEDAYDSFYQANVADALTAAHNAIVKVSVQSQATTPNAHGNHDVQAPAVEAKEPDMSDKAKQIKTDFWAKPIPVRQFDWTATFDGYEPGEPIGHGATEQEAIADLLESAGA